MFFSVYFWLGDFWLFVRDGCVKNKKKIILEICEINKVYVVLL